MRFVAVKQLVSFIKVCSQGKATPTRNKANKHEFGEKMKRRRNRAFKSVAAHTTNEHSLLLN